MHESFQQRGARKAMQQEASSGDEERVACCRQSCERLRLEEDKRDVVRYI